MVTTPRPHMTLSAGARAGLTAVMKGLSFDVARDNVTINNLLPERFDTDRQEQMARVAMKRDDISYEEARRRQVDSIAARRLGQPEEFGAMRSEEHTSELQSLMRISYAVFCLKKKNYKQQQLEHTTQ